MTTTGAEGAKGMNELSAAYTPWGRRAAAILVDSLVLLPIALLSRAVGNGHRAALVTLAVGLLGFAYVGLFQSRSGDHNGQTLGQQWLGVRVTRDNGRPISFAFGALRRLLILAPIFTFMPGACTACGGLRIGRNRMVRRLAGAALGL